MLTREFNQLTKEEQDAYRKLYVVQGTGHYVESIRYYMKWGGVREVRLKIQEIYDQIVDGHSDYLTNLLGSEAVKSVQRAVESITKRSTVF